MRSKSQRKKERKKERKKKERESQPASPTLIAFRLFAISFFLFRSLLNHRKNTKDGRRRSDHQLGGRVDGRAREGHRGGEGGESLRESVLMGDGWKRPSVVFFFAFSKLAADSPSALSVLCASFDEAFRSALAPRNKKRDTRRHARERGRR